MSNKWFGFGLLLAAIATFSLVAPGAHAKTAACQCSPCTCTSCACK